MFPIHRRLLASLVAAPALASIANAQTYLGPTPYLSRADSPLLLTKPALDDLEDGALDLLGVSADHGAVYGPAGNCDSVDADDGATIGSFPTSAGVVWTDGGAYSSVTFEAFDASGASFGKFGPFQIADGSNSGQTAEDRFFGIACRGGISAIKVSNSSGGIEVDHVQYSVGALSLEANDTTLSANDPIDLTVAGGLASQPALLVAIGANGTPLFLPVFQSTFDGAGELSLSTTTPSGLAGLVLDLVGLGIAASGKVKFSNEVALTFN